MVRLGDALYFISSSMLFLVCVFYLGTVCLFIFLGVLVPRVYDVRGV